MSLRRSQKPILLKHSILIVCEGSKTEITHFANLVKAQNVRDRFTVRIETSDGGGASATIKRANALAKCRKIDQNPTTRFGAFLMWKLLIIWFK